MESKNLSNLIVKHFDFLKEDYGFKYNASSHCYVKDDLKIEVQHVNGELKVSLNSKQKTRDLLSVIGEFLKKEFSYPEYFSSLVLSMGDVDSRLAYDAKLIKEYAQDIL